MKGRKFPRFGSREAGAIRVLIVDDNQELCRKIAEALRADSSFTVAAMAFNGLEALEILEKQEVDLILLDLIMPYLDGLGVMHKLKEKQWP
ncbi:MAG: response regulator, partial [Firmicutes bacterium]|nr:response regulator [Bacillota bacterium]